MVLAFSKIKTKQLKMESMNLMRKNNVILLLKNSNHPPPQSKDRETQRQKQEKRDSLKKVKYVNIYSPTFFKES